MSNNKLLLIGIATLTYIVLSKRAEAQPEPVSQVNFSIYDVNDVELTETLENTTIYIKGTSPHSKEIYVIDNKAINNIGYGISDSNGNFNIPIYLKGTDDTSELIDITVIST